MSNVQHSLDLSLDKQVDEFCLITTAEEAANYAFNMMNHYRNDKNLKEVWQCIKVICESPLTTGSPIHGTTNQISVINKTLGANIALKLYSYYLAECENNNVIPDLILPLAELVSMADVSSLEEKELLALHSLNQKLTQKKAHTEYHKNNNCN